MGLQREPEAETCGGKSSINRRRESNSERASQWTRKCQEGEGGTQHHRRKKEDLDGSHKATWGKKRKGETAARLSSILTQVVGKKRDFPSLKKDAEQSEEVLQTTPRRSKRAFAKPMGKYYLSFGEKKK